MGAVHPIAWQHAYDGGRGWYTAGGHTIESYSEPLFLGHLLGGILWAAGYDLPKFDSISARFVDGRLKVVATHPNCYRCELQLRIRIKNRTRTIAVDASGTRTEAIAPVLPRGPRRYSVTLTDEPMAAHVTAHGSITTP